MRVEPSWMRLLLLWCPVTNLCWTCSDPMGCSTHGSPVLHYLPGACSNSCPLNQWCHPSHLILCHFPFSSCPQSFPASGFFPMSRLFVSGSQSIGTSASVSVLPMNIQDWFPLGLTGLISLQSKRLKNLLQHHSSKASLLQHSAFFMVQLSHLYVTTGKNIALTIWTFVNKVMDLTEAEDSLLTLG